MTQYITQLQPRLISSLRKQVLRNTQVELLRINKNSKQSYPKAHQDLSFNIQFQQSILSGSIINKNKQITPKDISVKLTGIYSICQKTQVKEVVKYKQVGNELLEAQSQFVDSILKMKEFNKKIHTEKFVEGTVTINWELLENQYIGQFQFIFQKRLPETATLLVDKKLITFCYYLELVGEDIHYLREMEYKKKKKTRIIDHQQINYVVQDFQTRRMCCLREGSYRIEVFLDRATTSQILGTINYFRKQPGALPPISKCNLTLYAQLKYNTVSKRDYEYIHIINKIIEIESEPQFGIMSIRFKLILPSNISPNIKNQYCTLRYFLIVTPEKINNKDFNIRILQQSIRPIILE